MSRALPRGTRGREARDVARQRGPPELGRLDDLDWGLDAEQRQPGDRGLNEGVLRDGLFSLRAAGPYQH